MNRPMKRLWSAIERLPDLAAVPGGWRSLLGSEYELASRFLLPTQRIARSGKCTVPGRNCVHEFRPWKGKYLSVCPDGCDTVTLPGDEVVIHRLDTAALGREIGEAMGLEVLPAEAVPELPNVLRIGEYVPLAGYRFPVYLVFTGEPDQLRCDVGGLAARAEPFVLLAPTRSAVTHVCADLLKRAKSSFLPLNELLGQGDDGRLALLDGHTADKVLADFRAIHVPQPEDDDGMVELPTPAYEFKVVGEVWHVRFGDEYGEVVDRVGMARLFTLLLQPNPAEPISALRLCGVNNPGIEERYASHQEVLDTRTRGEYREKLAELNTEIEEANNSGNVAEAERLTRKREAILRELRKDSMKRRKGKELGPKDAREKAAEAVSRSLKTIYATLRKKGLPKAADHLEKAIKIESYAFAYRPGPQSPAWHF